MLLLRAINTGSPEPHGSNYQKKNHFGSEVP